MQDFSELDKKYFVDNSVYNCPHCNRNNVPYGVFDWNSFNWSAEKICYVYFVKCSFCEGCSMHLSYKRLNEHTNQADYSFNEGVDIDSNIFYSVPTSFFTIDKRIPNPIREAITEAESCVKMNFLTGASACARKAIYELLKKENASGDDYKNKVKSLKEKFKECDPKYFDTLGQIQGMASDMVHEQSWPKWNCSYIKLLIETLKTIVYEIYVLPLEKALRRKTIETLHQEVAAASKAKKAQDDSGDAAQES